jgi:hypothetical protein
MKIIHIFTQEKTLTAIMYPEMFLKHFFIHPTEFLSSFHTTMRISHYKLYSIYIVIVCKYWYSVSVKDLLFNSNELTLGDHRYIFCVEINYGTNTMICTEYMILFIINGIVINLATCMEIWPFPL